MSDGKVILSWKLERQSWTMCWTQKEKFASELVYPYPLKSRKIRNEAV